MEEKEKIPDTSAKQETPTPETNPGKAFFKVQAFEYKIGDKTFFLQTDFTYEELEWLDVVYERLTPPSLTPSLSKGEGVKPNEIKGSFTRDEIEKTLKILLIPNPNLTPSLSLLRRGSEGEVFSPPRRGEGVGFTHDDFLKTRESQSVKIIADFFLTRAVLGFFIKSSLTN